MSFDALKIKSQRIIGGEPQDTKITEFVGKDGLYDAQKKLVVGWKELQYLYPDWTTDSIYFANFYIVTPFNEKKAAQALLSKHYNASQ